MELHVEMWFQKDFCFCELAALDFFIMLLSNIHVSKWSAVMANSVENTQKKSLQRTAKIPKIMGVANKKPFCNATPLCAFYAAVFWVDADFLDITYSFVCSCLEYFEIAFTLPKSLYACILWIEVSVMFGPIFTFFDGRM